MDFTKEQLSELICKHTEKENGLQDLIEIMLELSKMDLSTQILLDQDMPKHYVSRLIKRVCK